MGAIPVSFTGVMWYPDLSIGGGPMPGGPPLGFWGGVAPPYVDIGPPGPQPPGGGGRPPLGFWGGRPPPYVDIGGPTPQPPWGAHPAHPIWRPDLGFWGGRPPPYVDIGGPGPQPHPEHPIYFPPPGSPPPLGIWGGPFDPPRPTHPIVLPPNLPPEIPPPDGGGPALPIDWKVAWTPTTGWIVVGVPSGAHPAPSATPPAK